ncbi:DUF3052 domain-containing protein [Georgenia sp. Z1491]|uniref:DUF3052 domain-containing protein n=1 Tax=Georgenia sp. Z1491 TaxID=3416707 RepID=UPI003CF1228D
MHASAYEAVAGAFAPGQVVQEFWWDEDADDGLREAVEKHTGTELVDENHSDVCDGAIIWWRRSDTEEGDLTDLLVDAQANLDDGGTIWVLTPKPTSPEHVGPAEISEAAQIAGMNATSAVAAGSEWSGTRVVSRSRGK